MPGIQIKDAFLAPWGLPTEDLPLHIIWEGDVANLTIKYPEDIEFKEIHNVENVHNVISNGKDNIIELRASHLATPGYFGAILEVPEKYEDSVEEHDVCIDLHSDDGSVSWEGKTHTIRPQVQVIDHPDKIVLTESADDVLDLDNNTSIIQPSSENSSIKINMRYVGFGMAKVAVSAYAEGELISKGKSLTHDFIEAILDSEIHKQDIDELGEIPDEWIHPKKVEVPQEEIEDLFDGMSETLRSDESLTEKYDTEELFKLANLLERAEQKSDSEITSSLYQFVEMMFLNSVLNVVDRHPTENVSLTRPQTKIKTEAKVREMKIKCRLKDNLDNEYEPKEIEIEIDDRRDEGGVFEADLISEWENYQVDPDKVFDNE